MGPIKLEKLGMVHVFPFTTPLNIDPDLRRCGVGLVFVFSTKFGRHLRTMISTPIQIQIWVDGSHLGQNFGP